MTSEDFPIVTSAIGKILEANNKNTATIILMGGEPLLVENKILVKTILDLFNDETFEVEVITNGTTIEEYQDIISKYSLSSV